MINLNKVYVVFQDNGESFEDYDYWITKIFSSEEKAKKYIKNSKAKEQRLCEKLPYRDKHDFWLKEYEIEEIRYESKKIKGNFK